MAKGQRLLYGFRPEHMAPSDDGTIVINVVVVEPTGTETQIVARADSHDIAGLFRNRCQVTSGAAHCDSPSMSVVRIFSMKQPARGW